MQSNPHHPWHRHHGGNSKSNLTAIGNKTIVLTGALEPALFKTSDAVFNIGCALGAVQSLPPGVYIAMNGKVFPADKVRKNLEKNKFETAFPTQAPVKP